VRGFRGLLAGAGCHRSRGRNCRHGLDVRRLAKEVDPLVAVKRELPHQIVAELSAESLDRHLEAGFCQPIGEVLPPVIPDMVVLPELLVTLFPGDDTRILERVGLLSDRAPGCGKR
jgi:hypothetical protein